jgi:hypothetical protein
MAGQGFWMTDRGKPRFTEGREREPAEDGEVERDEEVADLEVPDEAEVTGGSKEYWGIPRLN